MYISGRFKICSSCESYRKWLAVWRTDEESSNLGVLLRGRLLWPSWYRLCTVGGTSAIIRGHFNVRSSIVILVYESGLLRRLGLRCRFLNSLLRGSLRAILLCLRLEHRWAFPP
jgi:hypothetical protein